ncbi:hypothetical protein FQN54_009970 [Arachnomyces sp. PD_36]|nr:hypothetical protein FQN54_009970 [Arachnomyces sp. PD_36]
MDAILIAVLTDVCTKVFNTMVGYAYNLDTVAVQQRRMVEKQDMMIRELWDMNQRMQSHQESMVDAKVVTKAVTRTVVEIVTITTTAAVLRGIATSVTTVTSSVDVLLDEANVNVEIMSTIRLLILSIIVQQNPLVNTQQALEARNQQTLEAPQQIGAGTQPQQKGGS